MTKSVTDNLKVRQAAAVLQILEHGILSLIETGELAAFDIAKAGSKRRTWRIPIEELDDFIARRTFTPPEPKRRRRRRSKQTTAVRKYF